MNEKPIVEAIDGGHVEGAAFAGATFAMAFRVNCPLDTPREAMMARAQLGIHKIAAFIDVTPDLELASNSQSYAAYCRAIEHTRRQVREIIAGSIAAESLGAGDRATIAKLLLGPDVDHDLTENELIEAILERITPNPNGEGI